MEIKRDIQSENTVSFLHVFLTIMFLNQTVNDSRVPLNLSSTVV